MEPHSTAQEFKTLLLGVRPPRVAVLIDRADGDWENTCLRLIEFFATAWGGNHSLIVPTYGKSIDRIFWQLLESFDPDYIYSYRKTLRDLKLAKPDEYAAFLKRETDRAASGSTSVDDRFTKQIDDALCNAITSQFQISPALQAELRYRVAPFYFMEHIVQPGFLVADSEAHYPLTAITGILNNCDHTSTVTVLSNANNNIPQIWHASFAGSFRESYFDKLKNCGIELSRKEFGVDNAGDLIDLGVLRTFTDDFPFSLSMMKLAYYASIKVQHWREPSVVVVGMLCFAYSSRSFVASSVVASTSRRL
jgi:hypothetical protein